MATRNDHLSRSIVRLAKCPINQGAEISMSRKSAEAACEFNQKVARRRRGEYPCNRCEVKTTKDYDKIPGLTINEPTFHNKKA